MKSTKTKHKENMHMHLSVTRAQGRTWTLSSLAPGYVLANELCYQDEEKTDINDDVRKL